MWDLHILPVTFFFLPVAPISSHGWLFVSGNVNGSRCCVGCTIVRNKGKVTGETAEGMALFVICQGLDGPIGHLLQHMGLKQRDGLTVET